MFPNKFELVLGFSKIFTIYYNVTLDPISPTIVAHPIPGVMILANNQF